MKDPERTILHIDMDAFYASVEQRDDPSLRDRPLVIGSDPEEGRGRGVVSTCSYEARKYGIHSAQPISRAYRRCPNAVFMRPDIRKYAYESRKIREILYRHTPCMEFISLDEAFLDITGSLGLFGGAERIARSMQSVILEERGLSASIGVAPNKMTAKIASDLKKPRGIVIVPHGEAAEFLHPLSIRRLWGIGEKTGRVLDTLGIRTIGELAACSRRTLTLELGSAGEHLQRLARGIDNRPVETVSHTKSIGNEITFSKDTADMDFIRSRLLRLSEKVFFRLWKHDLDAYTVVLKIRFADFSTHTRSRTLEAPPRSPLELYRIVLENLNRCAPGGRKIRLIGVSGKKLRERSEQLDLFEQNERKKEQRDSLNRAVFSIKDRFGDRKLGYGNFENERQ